MDENHGGGDGYGDDVLSTEDVDSMDVHSRTDDSLTSDLQFQEQLHGVISPAPSSRKRTKKVPASQRGAKADFGPKSRARPRKPNEPTPFLSIDNLPVDKLTDDPQQFARQTPNRVGSSKQGMRAPINTPTPQTRTTTPHANLRSASSASWNTVVPKRHRNLTSAIRRGAPPNHQIKTPFKHAVDNPEPRKARVAPDQALKEQTAMATVAVAKTMARQKPPNEKLVSGKLLKAKLKPLNVVKVQGPSMNRCRGIVAGSKVTLSEQENDRNKSDFHREKKPIEQPQTMNWDPWGLENKETRSYESSPSKTLQRRRRIMNTIAQDNIYERPQTMESLHRTSIASDLTEERERELNDDLENAQADILNNESDEDGVREPPNTIASNSNANSRFTAASLNHAGPTPSGAPSDASSSAADDTEQNNFDRRTPDGDTGFENTHTPVKVPVAVSESVTPSSEGQLAEDEVKDEPVAEERKEPVQVPRQSAPRGLSASTIHAEDFAVSLDQVEQQNRPRSVQDPNQRKEVRFADVDEAGDTARRTMSAMPRLNSDAETDEEENDKPKRKGSCKDEADQSKNDRDEDDDGDDPAGGGGGAGRNGGSKQRNGSASRGGRRVGSGQGSRPSSRQGSAGSGGKKTNAKTRSSFGAMFDEPEETKKPVYRKPKVKPFTWGDTYMQKPLEDTTELTVEGVRQSWYDKDNNSDDDSGIGMTSATLAYNIGRPYSSQGSRNPQRPLSARHKDYMVIAQSRMKAREEDEGKVRPRTARPSSARPSSARPSSAKRQVTATANSVKKTPVTRPFSATRRVRSAGSTRKQPKAGQKCSYCGQAASSKINYHQGIYFSVCEACSNQANSADPPAIDHTESLESFDTSDFDISNKQLVLASKELVEGVIQHSESELSLNAESVTTEGGSSMMSNLDDLDDSLSRVQAEIRECIAQASGTSQHTTEETATPTVPSDFETNSGSQSLITPRAISEPKTGAFSEKLVDAPTPQSGGFAYRMTVFQFTENEVDEGVGFEEKGKGEISSYDVTMMDEKDMDGVKNEKEKEGAALLEMLCQQLEKSTVRPPEEKGEEKIELSPLEVVAESKPIRKAPVDEDKFSPAASLAPLCFKINARPPRGSMYYFAYGLDMNPDRFGNYLRRKTEERFWGLLYGFRLAFNKKGLDEDGGGFPNIMYDQGSSVEGCLYLITPAELELLDKCLGYPQHFEHVMLPVWLLNCNDPDDLGVAQYCVPALMYIARDLWIHQDTAAIDNSYAVDQCMKAGDILSTSYRAQMAGMAQFGSADL